MNIREATTGGRKIRGLILALPAMAAIFGGVVFGQRVATLPAGSTINDRPLMSPLRYPFRVVGTRLSAAANSRSVLIGAITRDNGKSVRIQLIHETSGLARVDEDGAPSIGHDGKAPWAQGAAAPSQAQSDLLESLFNDSVEHLFRTQSAQLPTRYIGSRFRTDDGKAKNYKGPYYDIVAVTDTVVVNGQPAARPRVYWLNSETGLLDKVRTRVQRGGSTVNVDTDLSGWNKPQDNSFPAKVERLENGKVVWTVNFSAAATGPPANDRAFERRN